MPDLFKALADETRRELLLRIAEAPTSVNDLAAGFALSRPAVSRHIKQLQNAGLVSFSTGDQDGRQRICHAELQALVEVDDYLGKVRQFWQQKMDGLGDYLKEQSKK